MTGGLSLPRVFLLAYLLLHTRIAAPFLLQAMGSHRTGSGVCLRVYLCDMSSQTVTMHLLAAMFAAAFFEHAWPPVLVLRTMMPLMLQKSTAGEVASAEFALSILGGQRFHFPMSSDSDSAPVHW